MSINTDRLIELSYEIEGLLLLARQKGDDTPAQLWQLIADKANEIAKETQDSAKACEDMPDTTNLSLGVVEESASPEIEVPSEATPTTIETKNPDIPAVPFIIPAEPDEHTYAPTEITQEDPTMGNLPTQETDSTPTIAEADETDHTTEINVIPVENHISETSLQENAEPLEIPDTATDGDSESEINDDEATYNETINDYDNNNSDNSRENDDKPITLDEKLAREQTRNLKKAFSLNDRFRFRRELFGNSDTEFADAINMVEAMESLNEANEYFYDDLQWDPENPEVIDFMQIITKHFQSR